MTVVGFGVGFSEAAIGAVEEPQGRRAQATVSCGFKASLQRSDERLPSAPVRLRHSAMDMCTPFPQDSEQADHPTRTQPKLTRRK